MNYFFFYLFDFFYIVLNWPHGQRRQNTGHYQCQNNQHQTECVAPLRALTRWAKQRCIFCSGPDANSPDQGGPFASARYVRDALVSYALEVEDEVSGSKPICRVVLVSIFLSAKSAQSARRTNFCFMPTNCPKNLYVPLIIRCPITKLYFSLNHQPNK
jgi:hypothetical protein